ncbi:MAG: hypothetical protein ABW135_18165 [Thermoleophilaceae bacterium]
MARPRFTRAALLLAACAAAVLAAAAPAGAKTHAVSGKQIVVNEEAGTSKMRGGLIGAWALTSFEELETSPWYHAKGTETFKGCLDRRRDRSCKGDPSGTLSFTFEFWGLFASEDPASQVWGACWHPVVSGTGDFAGAQGVLVFADTPTHGGLKTRYIGNITLKGHAARAGRAAAVGGSGCGPTG